jgi:hypothetical protein
MGNLRRSGYTAPQAHGVFRNSSKWPDRKMMQGAQPNTLQLDLHPRRGIGQPICRRLLEFLDRRRWSIFYGMAAAYLLGFNGQWRVEPDGGLYLNLARNLALGRGYTYGGLRHDTVYPGFPLVLSGLYRISSTHIIFTADVFILLCSVASLALIYRLILLAYDRPTAVLVTLGVGLSHEFFQYSFEILTEMPFVLGVMALLAGHEAVFGPKGASRARWWDWAILAAGVVVTTITRPTMIGLLAAWIVALLYAAVARRNWKAGAALVICALVVCTFLLFDPRRSAGHGLAGGYELYAINQLSQRHVFWPTVSANVRALLDGTLAKGAFGMPLGSKWVNALFGVVVAASAIALIAKRLLWGLWVILTLVPLILFVSSDPRYLLPILPIMVLGWWNLVRAIDARIPGRMGNALVLFLLTLGMAPNIAQVIGMVYHQRLHPFLAEYKDGKYEPFAHIAPDVARETGPDDVVFCPAKSARMIAFLADRMCFEENEAHPAAEHFYVIVDPTDGEYLRWLRKQHIQPEGKILASAVRRRNQPGIYLMRARIGAEK